jgi:hypothetical protein
LIEIVLWLKVASMTIKLIAVDWIVYMDVCLFPFTPPVYHLFNSNVASWCYILSTWMDAVLIGLCDLLWRKSFAASYPYISTTRSIMCLQVCSLSCNRFFVYINLIH